MTSAITKTITDIDKVCKKVSTRVNMGLLDPSNSESEKKTFLKNYNEGKNINPSFSYKITTEIADKYKAYQEELTAIKLDNTPLNNIFLDKISEIKQKIELILAVDTPEFSNVSEKLYAPPNDSLIRIAETILKTFRPSKKPTNILKSEALAMLNEAFQILGMDWSIENVHLITSARVHALSEKLSLRKNELFSKDYVKRLIVHEIGTHALRAENGKKQPLKLFRYGFAGYLETEEGLAAYNELRAGLMTNSILRNYAGRVLAISYAREGDFTYTYTQLKKYFTEHFAWKLTLRAKRGIPKDCKGAYTKDSVYLRGLISVLRFALENDTTPLYVGKIGIEHIPLLDSIPNLEPKIFTIDALLTKQELSASERGVNSVDAERILLSGNQI